MLSIIIEQSDWLYMLFVRLAQVYDATVIRPSHSTLRSAMPGYLSLLLDLLLKIYQEACMCHNRMFVSLSFQTHFELY